MTDNEPWQHSTGGWTASELGQDRPHSARMYDYYLGGKTNYSVDQQAAQEVIRRFPTVRTVARVNRAFMERSTRFLAAECGVRQFLDIGTGIPTRPNLHEVAQEAEESCRVAYVDNDRIVLNHADSLLTSSPEGRTSYLDANLADPGSILAKVETESCLDLDQPVALALHAILHFVPDEQDPYGIVERLLECLAPGSYLSLSHCTGDYDPEAWQDIAGLYTTAGTPAQVRSRSEVERFFTGLELVSPGVVVAHRWRPEPASGPSLVSDTDASIYAGVARKP